jgi:hypothetical protein
VINIGQYGFMTAISQEKIKSAYKAVVIIEKSSPEVLQEKNYAAL